MTLITFPGFYFIYSGLLYSLPTMTSELSLQNKNLIMLLLPSSQSSGLSPFTLLLELRLEVCPHNLLSHHCLLPLSAPARASLSSSPLAMPFHAWQMPFPLPSAWNLFPILTLLLLPLHYLLRSQFVTLFPKPSLGHFALLVSFFSFKSTILCPLSNCLINICLSESQSPGDWRRCIIFLTIMSLASSTGYRSHK